MGFIRFLTYFVKFKKNVKRIFIGLPTMFSCRTGFIPHILELSMQTFYFLASSNNIFGQIWPHCPAGARRLAIAIRE